MSFKLTPHESNGLSLLFTPQKFPQSSWYRVLRDKLPVMPQKPTSSNWKLMFS